VHEKFDGNATFHFKSKLFALHIYTDLGKKASHHSSAVTGVWGGGNLNHAIEEW